VEELRTTFHVHLQVMYGFLGTDFLGTHNYSAALRVVSLYRKVYKSVKKCGNQG
jgi:hypothetical protein